MKKANKQLKIKTSAQTQAPKPLPCMSMVY